MSRESDVLSIPKASRALVVGATGTGKSSLAEILLVNFLRRYDDALCLILDTKPRFQAHYETNGLTTKLTRRYKKWGYGSYIPGSYRLPLSGNIGLELDTVWKSGGRIAIAQTDDKDEWGLLAAAARVFYQRYGAKKPRILYVDEQSDFFEMNAGRLGAIFQQTARSGRERNIAYLACTQRPRFIPKVLLTELSRLYLFELDYMKDRDHIEEIGLTKALTLLPVEHSFLYWDKKLKLTSPSGILYSLDFERKTV